MNSLAVETIISHPFLICGLAIVIWYTISTAVSWYRLSHIPGPFLASISNIWMIRTSTSKRMSDIFVQTANEYGSVVRIGPNQVLTNDPEVLRRTGAVRGAYNRDEWYIAFRWQPYSDNVFNICDRFVHDKRKAQIVISYNISGREVDLIEPSIDEQILSALDLIRTKYASHSETQERPLLEFADFSSYLTMDVITRAAFGKEFGHIKTDSDVTGFLSHLRNAWPVISLVNETPFLRNLLYSRTYLSFFGPKATDKTGPGRLMSGVVNIVQQRFIDSNPKSHKDMLASWIYHGLNQGECQAEGLLALIAGSETTASVIRITMLSLLSSPSTYQKLKTVIKETLKNGTISKPISYKMAQDIPYLRAVVYEGLRMRPGTPITMPKIVPPQGETIQDKFIPGGTLISANISSLLKSTDIFGPDVELFRPGRWLDSIGTKKAEMEREVEMMFGNGRWMCAGKPIAFMELYKTFFELFRHFDFQIANPSKPWNSKCYSVFVDENMWLRVDKAKEY